VNQNLELAFEFRF